ncbi:hypothetical protein [Geomicrobium sp. JCM 19038]|uniref:hypothetical protein n=1 Tax=Geomicrobium sp. JCM 19038 TaxID=1460635 RepID=UPI00045F2C33|nr:hypothetical protein [Geomicrobium sp. JCM 19038]GAK07798.1 hypothetical protein JCM19038_1542 [Geomicrobium sp. JCM 19038]
MDISKEQTQPQTFKDLMRNMSQNGKRVFLVSIPGTLLISVPLITVLFFFFDYMIQLGVSVVEIEALRIFNQALLFSVLGVQVFYLLLLDRELPFKKRVLTGLKKTALVFPAIIVATILYTVLTTFGLALLVIPGLIIYAYLGLFAQTIAFENKGIVKSLMRSRQLVIGSFWRILGLLLLIIIASNVLIVGAEILFLFMLGTPIFWVDIVINTILYLFMMPFIGSLYMSMYFDLRARQEAFDYAVFSKERGQLVS